MVVDATTQLFTAGLPTEVQAGGHSKPAETNMAEQSDC